MKQTDHFTWRFSLAVLLGIITALAILFAALRASSAPPLVHLYVGTLALLICAIHVRNRSVPIDVSILAGTFTLPLFFVGTFLHWVSFVDRANVTRIDLSLCFIVGLMSMIPGAIIGLFMGLYVRICIMLAKLCGGVKDVSVLRQTSETTGP